MFIKERHLVPLLVLIATTFLLFLSTRKPSCVREGLQNIYHNVNDDYQNANNSNDRLNITWKINPDKVRDAIQQFMPR